MTSFFVKKLGKKLYRMDFYNYFIISAPMLYSATPSCITREKAGQKAL
jgi:hypothetical protein